MKLSKLLATRKIIIRQATLANTAFSYLTLKQLADRVATAKLSGLVALRRAGEGEEQFWISLTALEGSQSVIDEHFVEEDVWKLADALAFVSVGETAETSFRLEELEKFITPLRSALEEAGVLIDVDGATADFAI